MLGILLGGCRAFYRAKRHFQVKPTAKHAAAPFISPFKTAFLGQTNGKTCGGAVHFAVQNGIFRTRRATRPRPSTPHDQATTRPRRHTTKHTKHATQNTPKSKPPQWVFAAAGGKVHSGYSGDRKTLFMKNG